MKHIFYIYHPAVIFAYIVSALFCTMATKHPVFVVISLLCAAGYALYLCGRTAFFRTLKYCAIIFLVISIINPLFNQKGFTVMFKIGNAAFTFESFFYGMYSGGTLFAVILWFQCYQKLITNDRFLYLFGKAAPTIALMISMVLKWIPVTSYKARSIRLADAAITGNAKKTKRQRLRSSIHSTGILMSWSMEDSIETADSMRARGYGTKKRGAYQMYTLAVHDTVSLCVILALAALCFTAIIVWANGIMFYPVLAKYQMPVYIYVLYALLLLYPLLLELKEKIKWRLLK